MRLHGKAESGRACAPALGLRPKGRLSLRGGFESVFRFDLSRELIEVRDATRPQVRDTASQRCLELRVALLRHDAQTSAIGQVEGFVEDDLPVAIS